MIGRLLEHSRLFWFANGGDAELFLGSADWMPRNLDRRVEAVVPVLDPQLCLQLEWLMQLYLDDQHAWLMHSDGTYVVRNPEAEGPLAQQELMELWSLRSVQGVVRSRWDAALASVPDPWPASPGAEDPATTAHSAPAVGSAG